MKKFLSTSTTFFIIGIIPFFILGGFYLWHDPFKVIYQYNNYSVIPPSVLTNRDYISTEMFLKNKQKYKYNSFIFGSSRALAFKPSSWKKYLKLSDKPFAFDAAKESTYGIYKKIKYLDANNQKIDNALIIICRDYTFNEHENPKGHLYIKHPTVSGESFIIFHTTFFRAFLNFDFLNAFMKYETTKQYESWMENFLLNHEVNYDTVSNETTRITMEAEIAENIEKYYNSKESVFYKRDVEKTDSVQRIQENHVIMLKEIKQIFNKHNTDYRLIISPLYEQTKISTKDLEILKNIFGSKRIYDFSGKNQFTNSKYNYYEKSHYRPAVGDSILKIIYTDN